MKYLVILITLFSLLMSFVSCSPVQFSQTSAGTCSSASPCLNANGTATETVNYTFTQTNKVDILIVDDNSGSMTQEQQNMASSFHGLVDNLNSKGVDWQIAVTSTDVCSDTTTGLCQNKSIPGYNFVPGARGQFMGPQGTYPTYSSSYVMTPSTPNLENFFNQTIQRNNELGSGDERAIYASYLALFSGINPGFLRANSNFALIILSDEDERSVGGQCPTYPFEFALSPTPGAWNYSYQYPCDPSYAPLEQNDGYQNFINTFNSTYNGSKKLSVFSIVVRPGDFSCLKEQVAQGPINTGHYGNMYEAFAKQMATPNPANPGQPADNTYSICDNGGGQFTQDVATISGAITTPTNSVQLGHAATSVTSVVFTSNPQVQVPYTFTQGNSYITLNSTPPANATVAVTFTYTP